MKRTIARSCAGTVSSVWVCLVANLLLLLGPAPTAHAVEDPAPGSVSATTVKLPSAPGSFSGLADHGQLSVFSGQYSYSIPIDLPADRGGFAPQLTLAYHGAFGNDVVGIGWGLGAPQIRRTTREGVPTYTANDELELVGLGGGGRLIRLTAGPFAGELRVEGQAHAVRVRHQGSGFIVETSDGTRWLFDQTVSKPGDQGGVFAWYASSCVGVGGQTVQFDYTERRGHRLLTGLRWGPPHEGGHAFEVVLGYEQRADIVPTWSAGFPRSFDRRLNSVQVFAFGAIRKTYTLSYAAGLPFSRLSSVTITGAEPLEQALPTTTFTYGEVAAPTMVQPDNTKGWRVGERETTLLDVDGDGLADLARFELGQRSWKKNWGDRFGDEVQLEGGAKRPLADLRFMDLDADLLPEMVYQVDDTWRVYRLSSSGPHQFTPKAGLAASWPGSFGVSPVAATTHYADIDGDDRTDVLEPGTDGIMVRLAEADGLGPARLMQGVSAEDGHVDLGDSNVQLHDLYGDGIADVFWLADAYFKVYQGRGDATFETSTRTWCWPWNWDEAEGRCRVERPVPLDPKSIRFADLNRDGLLDLIRVAGSVYFYPGRFSEAGPDEVMPFGEPVRLPKPPAAAYDDVVTIADLNGNGSQDIVWSTSAGMVVLDIAGSATQSMLTRIDNGLGYRTSITYTTSTLLSLGAEAANQPWQFKLPTTMVVPFEVTHAVPDDPEQPIKSTRHFVRDGFWDADERRFGGFLQATVVTVADTQAESLMVSTDFERGVGTSRVLRGMAKRVIRADGLGKIFDETMNTHDAVVVADLPDVPLLRVPVVVESNTAIYEGLCSTQTESHRFLRETFAHDDYGNVIEKKSWGRVTSDGTDIPGDEVVARSSYLPVELTASDEPWLGFSACDAAVYEGDGTTLRSRQVTVFDEVGGVPGTGCVGGIADGRPRYTYGWLDESPGRPARWVLTSQAEYDAWGNVIEAYAEGVTRVVDWDSDAMFPVAETIAPGGGAPDLTWSVLEWDRTLGVPLRVREPNGVEAAVGVDSLGRVTHGYADVDGVAPLDLVAQTTYHLEGPRPWIESVGLEGGVVADTRAVQVFSASGAAMFGAVELESAAGGSGGQPLWIVDAYRKRNRLGLTVEISRPFESQGLPEMFPVGVASQTVTYDAQGRAIEQRLPEVPGAPAGGARKSLEILPLKVISTSSELAPTTSESDGLGRTIRTSRSVPLAHEREVDACVEVGECGTEVGCAACLALTEQVIVSGYDAAGRLLEHTYQPGTDAEVSHTFAYDSLGRLIYGASPDTGERGYTWSDEGRLLESESLVGASLVDTVEFTYDEAGRLLSRRGLDAGGDYDETWTFRYDAPVGVSPASSPETWGLLTAVTGPDGVATTAYDRMNRPIRTVRSVKDLVTESEFSVIRQMTLSPGGRVVAATIGTPRVGMPSIVDERIRLEHGYDRAGRLRHLGVGLEGGASAMLWEGLELTPSGATTLERLGNQVGTRYVRDVLDQVQGVSLSAAAISIRDTDWAGWGAPANTTLWNPATHTFEAAGVEAFATAFDAVSSGANRYEVGLSRNAYGALTAVADSAVAPGVRSRDAAFEYDLAGRLVAAEVSEHHFEYAYDALQNMTRRELVVVPGGAITPDLLSGDYRHGDAATGKRRLQQVTMPGTSTALATFSYDLAGRMTRVGLSAATDTTMAFDAFDRVRVVDEPGSGLTQHRYDAAGERATTVWADGRIERYFGGGLTQREGRLELHVGLGGARVVARVNVPELPDGTPSISDGLGGAPAAVYLHQGVGHGPTVVTDAGGAVLEERVFEPYGTPLWVDADYELERLGYNGKVVDPSTGWSDHGARWHATRFARWLSVDPPLKGPGGLVEHGLMATPYGFVAGNPVMFWDPDGNQAGPAGTMSLPWGWGPVGGAATGVKVGPVSTPAAAVPNSGVQGWVSPKALTNPWAGNSGISISGGMGPYNPSMCRTVGPPCGHYGQPGYDSAEIRAYQEKRAEARTERAIETAEIGVGKIRAKVGLALFFGAIRRVTGQGGTHGATGDSASGGAEPGGPDDEGEPGSGTGRDHHQDIFSIKRQKGLGDIPAGSRSDAEIIGNAWVNGPNVKRFDLPNGGYGLTDGVRTFRLQFKAKSGQWKANFQENIHIPGRSTGVEVKNIHMTITDMRAP